MNANSLNYHYDDEIAPAHPPTESFDPPIEEIYPIENVTNKLFDDCLVPLTDPFADIVPSPDTNQPEDSSSNIALSENLSSIKSPSDPSAADATYEDSSSKAVNSRKDRIKEKVSKAKDKYPPKTKLIKKEPVLDKKQKQLIRNRISAQRSRDRKRQELSEMQVINDQLVKSKAETESQLAAAMQELGEMKKTVELLSPDSREEFNRIKAGLNNPQEEVWAGRPSIKRRTAFLMAGAMFGCLCLVACLSPFVITNGSAPAPMITQPVAPRGRLLAAPDYKQNCMARDQLQ